MLSEPQLSVTHVDTQCTKWIACCDLGDSQSTSELSLVHCIQCHHSHGWANDMFHIYNPKKMLPQGCGELKYLPSQWQKDIYPPLPTEMITCKITLFDSNWWFPLYLTGKVMGYFFTWFQPHSVPQNYFNMDIISLPIKEKLPFVRLLRGGEHHKWDATDGKLVEGFFKIRMTASSLYLFL